MHKRVHFEFHFRIENGLPMKMGSFKKSCLKNCYKILKFANFENGGTDIQGGYPACYARNLANFFTAAGQ